MRDATREEYEEQKRVDAFWHIADDVAEEFFAATRLFGPFHSAHEAYGILLEEVDELWDEIKAKQGSREPEKIRKEAIQVAAMAIRLIHDICNAGRAQV